MTDNALMKIPVITQAILQAQPLDVHSGQMGALEKMRFIADKIGATLEAKNDIGEALLRLYRDAGQRFAVEFPRGGNGSNQHGSKEQTIIKKRLADYGYDTNRAALCRKIASIPEDLFEDEILSIRLGEHISAREITTKYFVKKVALDGLLRQNCHNTDKPQPANTLTIDLDDLQDAAEQLRGLLSVDDIGILIDGLLG